MAFQQELHGKLSVTGSSSRAVGPGDRVSTLAVVGAHQGSIFAKDTRNPVQPANPSSEDKRPHHVNRRMVHDEVLIYFIFASVSHHEALSQSSVDGKHYAIKV
ncbi:hypothetical protein P8452_08306 [Trifolium repens]|nr:hypothetical protein P8452_08306 [Trifolium repens]